MKWYKSALVLGILGASLNATSMPAQSSQDESAVHITPRREETIRGKQKQSAPDTDALPKTEERPQTAPPLSEGESSSTETRIDISPPRDEAKNYPHSGEDDSVQEMHPFNPHKAQKDIEVGDYYFKQQNYRAALSRYEEALTWQDSNAEAMWKAALAAQKLKDDQTAAAFFAQYLKTLPNGDHAVQAKRELAALQKQQ